MMPNDTNILDALPIPALLLGSDGRIIGANHGASALFGDAIEGRHHITVLRQPALLDAVERASTGQGTVQAEYLTTEARRDVTWYVTCAPLAPGGVLLSFEDRSAMEDADQMRRDFVANVSHELRTPLTAILGFIETLKGPARNDKAARDKFLNTMEREAQRMNRLVADLLSLSKVEADARLRPTQTVDMARLVERVLHNLKPLIDSTEADLVFQKQGARFNLAGEDDQLSQVVTNLIENAIKYAGRSGPVEVTLSRHENHVMLRGDAIILTIRDHGDGIAAVHIPRLTERFYRIDSHRSRGMGGTGLGLAIVKHIVNRHRGRLRIESTPGIGSVFTVILPAA
jgi:two-component system phosphate regulon sensor histidine kinase PhoR